MRTAAGVGAEAGGMYHPAVVSRREIRGAMGGRTSGSGGYRLGAALAALSLLVVPPALSEAREPDARLFTAHALALRAAGVGGDDAAAKVLAGMPGVPMSAAEEPLPALWVPFFENAIVKLGRLRSPAPVALYYNPLLDVAVFTRWERWQGRYRVASVRALPGEHLVDSEAAVPLRPPWMAVEDAPVNALAGVTAGRLDAFRRLHPAEARDAAAGGATFAEAAAGLRAMLPRLAWNLIRRVQSAVGAKPWLEAALASVEEALDARDPAALAAAAPDTDPRTADTLARLPADFTSRLTLDLALESGEGQRLLIGSLPDDGDTYVLATCRVDGDACTLRRFELASLLE